jgi:hypothetical protein
MARSSKAAKLVYGNSGAAVIGQSKKDGSMIGQLGPSGARWSKHSRLLKPWHPNRSRRRRAIVNLANVCTQSRKIASRNLFFGAIIVGVGALGAVVLYGTTGWLWLVVHEGLH